MATPEWQNDFKTTLNGTYKSGAGTVTLAAGGRDGGNCLYTELHSTDLNPHAMVTIGADPNAPWNTRNEKIFTIGRTYICGFSRRLPATYIPDVSLQGGSLGNSLFVQWQASPDSGEDYRSPVLTIAHDEEDRPTNPTYIAVVRYDTRPTSPAGNTFSGTRYYRFGNILDDVDVWTDWVIQVKWQWDPSKDGYVRIWKKHQLDTEWVLVVNDTGPNCSNDQKGPYMSLGEYRWSWPGTVGDTTQIASYYSGLKIGDLALGVTFDDVAPSGASEPPPEAGDPPPLPEPEPEPQPPAPPSTPGPVPETPGGDTPSPGGGTTPEYNPPTYETLEGHYGLYVVDLDGTVLHIVDAFEYLEYTRTINGKGHHGWGSFHLHGAKATIPVEHFALDRLLSVRRKTPDGLWHADFDGVQRRFSTYLEGDDDTIRFLCEGFDLRSLLKRRIVEVPEGQAFVDLSGHYTDICRQLVRLQAGPLAGPRALPYLQVEPDRFEGPEAEEVLHFRYVNLAEELETYAGGVGFDFDIVRDGSGYTFRVSYPFYGRDLRTGNRMGNAPMVFSLSNGNMRNVRFVSDRTQEVTAAYVLGDGTGAERERLWRYSLIDAQNHSLWNRTEIVVEATQYTNTADLMAQGDAAVTNFRRYVEFTLEAVPVVGSLYGINWDLGDLVTVYWDGATYPARIVEVRVVLDATGEHIYPHIVYWPDDIDLSDGTQYAWIYTVPQLE